MNYLQWNNAIVRHFFNPEFEEKEVTLYFSEKIIEEIGQVNFTVPEEGFVNDFYKALRLGVNGISNDDYIQRILNLETKYIKGCRGIADIPFNYPTYLTYLLAFILPFTSGEANEELNMNNFHDYAKIHFEKNRLTVNYNRIIKQQLNQIDFLWEKINNWLIEINNFGIGYLEELSPPGNRKYVRKFEYHILFRKEQEERLSNVFDDNNILPEETIDEDKIKEILNDNKAYLRLSNNTIKKINQNDYIGEKIVKRALRYYKHWDGTTHAIEGKRGYSRNRLVLCLSFNTLNQQINFKYLRIFSRNGIPENTRLLKQNGEIIENVYQIREFYSNPIENCYENLGNNIELKDEANRNKFTWKAKDFFLFKRIPNFDWVEIPKVEYNIDKSLILCKCEYFDKYLKNWFDEIGGDKRIFDEKDRIKLEEGWIAFTVSTITNYPHNNIQELIPDQQNKPKIELDKSFYFDGQLFKYQLPDVWLENIEAEDDIVAQYHDNTEIQLDHIIISELNENGVTEEAFVNNYNFTEEHIKRINDEFKLVCGAIETHRFLKIVDFKKKDSDEIESLLPKRDAIGQMTNNEENYVKGLEHFFSNTKITELIPFQNQLDIGNVFLNNTSAHTYTKNTNYNRNHLGNILLNYISTKGKLTKNEFDSAVYMLLEKTNNNKDIKKRANYLRYQLQDAGFVDYNTERSILNINKPHLVIKPTKKGTSTFLIGARDNKLIDDIIETCEKNNLTIEIQDDNDILFPQIIYIKAKEKSHDKIFNFASQFDLTFKKEMLYTQFALASHFGDISEWREYVVAVDDELEDFEGGYYFSIEKLKFIDKPQDFNKCLAFVKFTEINGYKTIYRFWHQNMAYVITDQQFGIYLYLYMYKKISLDNYQHSMEERNWDKCCYYQDEVDNAYKLTNIVLYDINKKYFAVPLNCRLPRYLSISVALLNGVKPDIKYLSIEGVRYKGMYLIYKNIPKLFLDNTVIINLIKSELKSTLLEININI